MSWPRRAALAAGCSLAAALEIWPDTAPATAAGRDGRAEARAEAQAEPAAATSATTSSPVTTEAPTTRRPAPPAAPRYAHSETFMGQDFFEPFRWSFHTADDPTHGSVDYLGYADAALKGLVNATANRVYMGADHQTVIKPGAGRRRTALSGGRGPRGRPSVRIMSRQTYNGGMFVLDLDHVPTGCGVWPAFWMYGEDPDHIWPTWGEFDIVEGVHQDNQTMTTLHTTGGCNQKDVHGAGRQFTGQWLAGVDRKADNCNVNAEGQWGNQGCSQAGPKGSLGQAFNDQGGGTFAAEWDPAGGHFRTWFWPRGHTPLDLVMQRPQPETWGKPYSFFTLSDDDCSKDHFVDMRLVFDITFCGDFGSPTFEGRCPEVAKKMTCEEFVERHPENFTEAFWSIRGLDVYQIVKPITASDGHGGSQGPNGERNWPDAFGRFGVPVDVFGDGKGPTLPPAPPMEPPFSRPQGNPWAPPVTDQVFESEAGLRARLQGHGGAGPAGEGAAAEASALLARGAGTTTAQPEYVEPEYLPIAMKADRRAPVQPAAVASGWNLVTVGGLAAALLSLGAGFWRTRLGSRAAAREERRLGAAPLPTEPDFEL